jgi:exonuclease SbcC
MIESIELVNWKVHKHTKLDFRKGVNVLVGVMGAGKSSILDAISFGLFGSFPALSHKRVTLNNIISSKPKQEAQATVKITFAVGSDTYTVTRNIVKDGSTTARLDKNSVYVQSQPAKVNEEIERILKIDYDTFSRVVYSEQNNLDYFLELAKGDRKKQIDQMLGLDNFARAEDNAVSLSNNIKNMLSGEEEGLSQIDMNKLKLDMEALIKDKQQYLEEQKRLEAGMVKLEQEENRAKVQLDSAKSEYLRKQKLSSEMAALLAKQSTLKSELDKIKVSKSKDEIEKALAAKSAEAQAIDEDIKKLRLEERAATKKVSDYESKLSDAQAKLDERDKLVKELKNRSVDEIDSTIAKIDESINTVMKDLATAKSTKSENERWARELEKHLTACPVCNRELSEELRKQLLEQKNAVVKQAGIEVEKLAGRLEELKASKLAAERSSREAKLATEKLSGYAGIDAKVEALKLQLNECKNDYAKISNALDEKSSALDKLKKVVNDLGIELDSISRKERYGSEIAEASKLIESKSEEIKMIKTTDAELDALNEAYSKIGKELSAAREKLLGSKKYVSSIEAQIEEKLKGISKAGEIEASISRKKKLISDLGKFRSALSDTEGMMRNELVKSINSLMQSIWPELYPYLDYLSIRLTAKKDDYTLEANTGFDEHGEPQWLDVNSVASGGERSIACLAMRIALAMVVVPNLRWIILDEPTHNLDENGINKLIDVLGNSLPKVVDQIFVITHDNSLRNISMARIYQIERDKNDSSFASAQTIS